MLLKPSSNSTILQSISISVVKSEPLSSNQWVLENKNHAPSFHRFRHRVLFFRIV